MLQQCKKFLCHFRRNSNLGQVEPHYSQKFGETYEIKNVNNRTDILFHKGNVVDDTKGCVLVGKNIGVKNDTLAVIDSTHAFNNFMAYFGNQSFVLDVVNLNTLGRK